MSESTDDFENLEPTSSMGARPSASPRRGAGLHTLSVAAQPENVRYGYSPVEPSGILNFVVRYGFLVAAPAAPLNVPA